MFTQKKCTCGGTEFKNSRIQRSGDALDGIYAECSACNSTIFIPRDEPNTRVKKFNNLESHAWYGKLIRKLSESERTFIVRFCELHEGKDSTAFVTAANRVYPAAIPASKNAALVSEILLVLR